MTGVLLLDKPEGVTSAGAIRALEPRLGRSKVGHLGTLDPFASGLLPLCLGEATKVARWLLLERKAYTGTIRLGVATDTLDRTGSPIGEAPVPELTPGAVEACAVRFVGPQRQVPPMYSALKRDGVPLYRLARRGIEVDRDARDIEIFAFELTPRPPDRLDFVVACSKGTYVRVLATDVAAALGTVGHLESLRRTRVGHFRVEDALGLEALRDEMGGAALPLIPVRDALRDLVAFPPGSVDLARLRHGQQAALASLPEPQGPGQTALVLDGGGEVAAVIEAAPGSGWRLARLLAGA